MQLLQLARRGRRGGYRESLGPRGGGGVEGLEANLARRGLRDVESRDEGSGGGKVGSPPYTPRGLVVVVLLLLVVVLLLRVGSTAPAEALNPSCSRHKDGTTEGGRLRGSCG